MPSLSHPCKGAVSRRDDQTRHDDQTDTSPVLTKFYVYRFVYLLIFLQPSARLPLAFRPKFPKSPARPARRGDNGEFLRDRTCTKLSPRLIIYVSLPPSIRQGFRKVLTSMKNNKKVQSLLRLEVKSGSHPSRPDPSAARAALARRAPAGSFSSRASSFSSRRASIDVDGMFFAPPDVVIPFTSYVDVGLRTNVKRRQADESVCWAV